MPDYERLYHTMFNAATTAVELLQEMKTNAAWTVLIKAQMACEEEYVNDGKK